MRKGTAITGHLNRVGGLQEERKYEALSPPCGKASAVSKKGHELKSLRVSAAWAQ